jgi:hypothetical protein
MTSVKFCVAVLPTPLATVNVKGYWPPVPSAGVPLRRPVVALKRTPRGSAPLSVRTGTGKPLLVTMNELAVPSRNCVVFGLVIPGAGLTTSVKF